MERLKRLLTLAAPIFLGACSAAAAPSQALLTLGVRALGSDGADHSTAARAGDRAIVDGATAFRPVFEIRLYRGDEVVLRCVRGQEGKGCRREGDKVIGEAPLLAGHYRAMAIASTAAAPAPTGRFDDDLAAAQRAGSDVVHTQLDVT